MATTVEGYGSRYQKMKNSKMRSVSPSHYEHNTDRSPARAGINNDSRAELQIGKVVAQLSDRLDGVQIKIVNITNIVKLLQKYTQTKDIQYEKEKQNEEYHKNFAQKAPNFQYLDMQTKINQLQSITQRAKAQITAMQGLRVSIQRQSSRKLFSSPQPYETMHRTVQSTSPNNTKQIMEEIDDIMDRMQTSLREQLNKKIDICMNFFKNAVQQFKATPSSSPTSVNSVMMQEQLHNMTLTINKVESDCNRNKMLMENKIEQIINYVSSLRRKQGYSPNGKSVSPQGSRSAQKIKNDGQSVHSQHSSISKPSAKSKSKSNKQKSKSKSISKSQKVTSERRIQDNPKITMFNKIEQQKKHKQIQLKEALRKKKENQEKLKMKR